ncbi:MAG: type I restriction endonuclease [Candidatus Delongbacteria bacterium]
MGFDEKIHGLIQRLPSLIDHLPTEEATKNALVMPFIAALGYDVFNPHEVVPEFTADVGLKKGEKVDYAIKRDGEIIILFECKKVKTDLSHAEMSQLFRYFVVTKARIAILTNGVNYWFYSDLEEPNKMDQRPFLELDLSDPKPADLTEVKRLARDEFNLDRMLSAANDLKYLSICKKILAAQIEQPDEELVRFFYARATTGGRFTASIKEQFTALVTRSFQQFISEKISDRLRSALQNESNVSLPMTEMAGPEIVELIPEEKCVTTEAEAEGYRIVRAIVCRNVAPERVVMRDSQTYCGILLDDNNRKPICRLRFNAKQKYLGVFGADKQETKIPILELTEIYKHADELLATVASYDQQKS